jgi:hypothetical protein
MDKDNRLRSSDVSNDKCACARAAACLSYKSFENRELAFVWGAIDIQADGWLGEGFRAEPQLRAKALEEQKKDGHEHIYKRNYLKDATLPGQHKQRCYEGAQYERARRLHFQPCLAMRAGKMRPGIEVKEKWRPHVVIASRAFSH